MSFKSAFIGNISAAVYQEKLPATCWCTLIISSLCLWSSVWDLVPGSVDIQVKLWLPVSDSFVLMLSAAASVQTKTMLYISCVLMSQHWGSCSVQDEQVFPSESPLCPVSQHSNTCFHSLLIKLMLNVTHPFKTRWGQLLFLLFAVIMSFHLRKDSSINKYPVHSICVLTSWSLIGPGVFPPSVLDANLAFEVFLFCLWCVSMIMLVRAPHIQFEY